MSAQRLAPLGCGDEDSGKLQEQFQSWAQGILEAQTWGADASAVVEPLEPIIEQVCCGSHMAMQVSCVYPGLHNMYPTHHVMWQTSCLDSRLVRRFAR